LYIFFISPMRAAYTAHLILFYLISLIISDKDCELWSSLLCNYLHLPINPLKTEFLLNHI
jgi:hypothetical protein